MKTGGTVKILGLAGSIALLVVQVANAKDKTTTTLASSANPAVTGQPVVLTASVASVRSGDRVPTGTVTFIDGTTALGTAGLNAAGQATYTGTNLSLGTHFFTANYNADGIYHSSQSPTFNQVITKPDTTVTLASSINPATVGDQVTVTASVTPVTPGVGTPTGSVIFKDGNATLAIMSLIGGEVSLSAAMSLGSHPLTALYNGDASFNPATSAVLTQVVTDATVLSVAIAGPNTVCPNSTNSINGPDSMDSYVWSVDGAATIVGSASNQTVSVAAASDCNTNFVVSLTVVSGASSTTVTQAFAVVDTTAPVITAFPADATYPCADFLPAANDTLVAASDDCGGAVTITHNADVITQNACANRYTVFRAYTATDACGNSNSRTQTITIADSDGPAFGGVPADATVSCSAVPPVETPVAVDNCEGNPQVAFNETSVPGSCVGSYVLIRTWTATDACGNTSVAVQKITVTDTTAPVLGNIPDCITLIAGNIPSPAPLIASDDCDPNPSIIMSESQSPADQDGVSVLTRTWTASDACGNASSAAQTITVVPLIAPHLHGAFANGQIEFTWDAQVGVSYQLQATDNVVDGTWVNVSNAVRATCSPATCCDAMNCSTPRFYRLQSVP